MESEYSMLKICLLMMIGPRFGLKKIFRNLRNELQREIVKFHNTYVLILIATLISAPFVLFLFWSISKVFALVVICLMIFILQILFIYGFFSEFDKESRKQKRLNKEIEYKKKSEEMIIAKIEKWKS